MSEGFRGMEGKGWMLASKLSNILSLNTSRKPERNTRRLEACGQALRLQYSKYQEILVSHEEEIGWGLDGGSTKLFELSREGMEPILSDQTEFPCETYSVPSDQVDLDIYATVEAAMWVKFKLYIRRAKRAF